MGKSPVSRDPQGTPAGERGMGQPTALRFVPEYRHCASRLTRGDNNPHHTRPRRDSTCALEKPNLTKMSQDAPTYEIPDIPQTARIAVVAARFNARFVDELKPNTINHRSTFLLH